MHRYVGATLVVALLRRLRATHSLVIAGLVPAISIPRARLLIGMAGTSLDKPGHDDLKS